ncbi:MAG: fatty acid desaturase [Inquilinaceae bacterium]
MTRQSIAKARTAPRPAVSATLRRSRFEAPTWLVIAVVYGGWAAVTWFHAALPLWLLAPAGACLLALHSSLQHETIHGHPTRNASLNAALGAPPLSLWLPYRLYRAAHLAHHRDGGLTCPDRDPESFYVTEAAWARMGPMGRALRLANQTLAGRMTIGPALIVGQLWAHEGRLVLSGHPGRRALWTRHLIGVTLVMTWVVAVCGLSPLIYVGLLCYPAVALGLLRSFAEHRAVDGASGRTASVERAGIFGLLFLNNNLHTAHHARPGVAWYRLPRLHRLVNGAMLAVDGAGLYRGYGQIARRHLFRPIAHPVHPDLAAPVPDRTQDRRAA